MTDTPPKQDPNFEVRLPRLNTIPGRESLRFRLHCNGMAIEDLDVKNLEDVQLMMHILHRALSRELQFMGLEVKKFDWRITLEDERENEEEQT